MSEERLAGKVCVITGTGGSMGRVAALQFAKQGGKIVGCDINVEQDAETTALVRAAGGEMTSIAPCDLTREDDCAALVELAIASYGRIDVLYNNAAMAYFEPMESIGIDSWSKTIDQELNLAFLLTRAAWPHLSERGGCIVNVGSTCGMLGYATLPSVAHAAAKGGVIAMTRQMAAEGRHQGIRVNSISPGLTQTHQTVPLLAEQRLAEPLLAKIMLGRVAQPEEIIATALFLASDESSYITGVNLPVDGGMTAW
ncbi:SDR family oxidoreductase [Sphingomonas sp. MG17]|uniref:SDR family oxidoreductase n=1 Tax=Sphingomonas tagetis TaxID=2949092 RepID=A0A9X2HQZ7_9SPHN|nr:SDR family oxidoreductase [Sphingomonas tagetis]MCP3730275.1 SDR family oxidoreductase [Sphingomonas tagetis]